MGEVYTFTCNLCCSDSSLVVPRSSTRYDVGVASILNLVNRIWILTVSYFDRNQWRNSGQMQWYQNKILGEIEENEVLLQISIFILSLYHLWDSPLD